MIAASRTKASKKRTHDPHFNMVGCGSVHINITISFWVIWANLPFQWRIPGGYGSVDNMNVVWIISMCVWHDTFANPMHYSDVIMGAMSSQMTSLNIVYSTVYSCADQRKHQSSASLAFVRGIHRSPVNSPHKWPVTQKMFPFDDVIMVHLQTRYMVSVQLHHEVSQQTYQHEARHVMSA